MHWISIATLIGVLALAFLTGRALRRRSTRAAIFRRDVGDGEHAEVVIEGRIAVLCRKSQLDRNGRWR
jgi:hypothetical protein